MDNAEDLATIVADAVVIEADVVATGVVVAAVTEVDVAAVIEADVATEVDAIEVDVIEVRTTKNNNMPRLRRQFSESNGLVAHQAVFFCLWRIWNWNRIVKRPLTPEKPCKSR